MRALLEQLREAIRTEAERGRCDADEARAVIGQIDGVLEGERLDDGAAVANLREALRLATACAGDGQNAMILRRCQELLGVLPGDPTTDPD